MSEVHFNLQGRIEADGHLRLDVPTQLPAGEAEVVLSIRSNTVGNNRYDFDGLAGRLTWRGDAVAEQRGLRNEW
jgi:hypothetical protein